LLRCQIQVPYSSVRKKKKTQGKEGEEIVVQDEEEVEKEEQEAIFSPATRFLSSLSKGSLEEMWVFIMYDVDYNEEEEDGSSGDEGMALPPLGTWLSLSCLSSLEVLDYQCFPLSPLTTALKDGHLPHLTCLIIDEFPCTESPDAITALFDQLAMGACPLLTEFRPQLHPGDVVLLANAIKRGALPLLNTLVLQCCYSHHCYHLDPIVDILEEDFLPHLHSLTIEPLKVGQTGLNRLFDLYNHRYHNYHHSSISFKPQSFCMRRAPLNHDAATKLGHALLSGVFKHADELSFKLAVCNDHDEEEDGGNGDGSYFGCCAGIFYGLQHECPNLKELALLGAGISRMEGWRLGSALCNKCKKGGDLGKLRCLEMVVDRFGVVGLVEEMVMMVKGCVFGGGGGEEEEEEGEEDRFDACISALDFANSSTSMSFEALLMVEERELEGVAPQLQRLTLFPEEKVWTGPNSVALAFAIAAGAFPNLTQLTINWWEESEEMGKPLAWALRHGLNSSSGGGGGGGGSKCLPSLRYLHLYGPMAWEPLKAVLLAIKDGALPSLVSVVVEYRGREEKIAEVRFSSLFLVFSFFWGEERKRRG